jgi:hypothetical protein
MAEGERNADPLLRDRLSQLAGFAPRMRDPQTTFGEWRGGDRVEGVDNCITALWFAQREWADQFVDMLYRFGWVREAFDWDSWTKTKEGKALRSDLDAIAVADSGQLAKLLTALERGDRFGEGTLAKAFDDGLLRAAAERAEHLLNQH